MCYFVAITLMLSLVKRSGALLLLLFFSCFVNAEQAVKQPSSVEVVPQVGKHVMSNMDAGGMILSLLMVLALIIISAMVLKRFNLVQQGTSQLKVITSLSLGTKERLVVVQVGDKQLLLGVTSSEINLLETLSEPLKDQQSQAAEIPSRVLAFLNKKQSSEKIKRPST